MNSARFIPVQVLYSLVGFWFFFAAAANALTGHGMMNGATPHIPFAFVANRGQANPAVRYVGSGPEFRAWFEDRGVTLQRGRSTARMRFESSPTAGIPVVTPSDPIGARANYLYGSDARHWQTDLPLFGSIHYAGVWPGVQLTYRAEKNHLKAEYLLAPRAAAGQIRLRFDGVARIQSDGTLRIHSVSGDFVEGRPWLYQLIKGERKEIEGGFQEFADGAFGFRVSKYDHSQPLIIDPAILFSGYFGGSSEDTITSVGIDSLNNVVVAGWTSSSDLPASSGARKTYGGSVDAFVAAFLPDGGSLIYCTYLGGSGEDQALGLAIDSTRNVYVTGWTSSSNFPVIGAFQSRLSGTRDAFVTKLSAAGDSLMYSTYLGGSGVDAGYAIGVDQENEAVVVGDSTSSNLPVTSAAFQTTFKGVQDVFVAKVSSAGSALVFLTYLGGNGVDHGSSVAIGTSGAIIVGGYTSSDNFPTVAAWQSQPGGGQDGFVAKLNFSGQKMTFSTYLGGSGGSTGAPEEVNAVAVDSKGFVTAAGTTSSANFPVTLGALQTTFGGETDGFVARFNNNGPLLQSTFLGGSLNDTINAIAIDFHGNAYVTGSTYSLDFPVQHPLQAVNGGLMDSFVVKLNTSLSTMIFGTYLGGAGSDAGNAIAVDAKTSMVVAGQTGSGNLVVTGSLQAYLPSFLSSFIAKIQPNFTLGVAYASQGQLTFTADPWHVASYVSTTTYGEGTDIPIVGDWTGTGKKRIGIFRNGTWILDTNGNGVLDLSDKTVTFGQAGDVPVVGDWRGTGQIALGLFRQGTFILDLSGHLSGIPTGLSDASFIFGQGGDIPIVADWSGSGTTKVGIFRNGLWLVDYSGSRAVNSLTQSYNYGQAGDLPVVGDWDSSGNPPKIGIYRSGLWVLDYDGDHVWTTPGLTEMALGFGFAGQTPLLF